MRTVNRPKQTKIADQGPGAGRLSPQLPYRDTESSTREADRQILKPMGWKLIASWRQIFHLKRPTHPCTQTVLNGYAPSLFQCPHSALAIDVVFPLVV